MAVFSLQKVPPLAVCDHACKGWPKIVRELPFNLYS